MKNSYLLIAILIFAVSAVAQVNGTYNDTRDGKIYKTVTIGAQTWMAENLAYKSNSGCWAYEDDITNVAKYGYLYNWETAKTACPTGWHLPSDAEWTELTTYLGGEDVAGEKMKSTSGWNDFIGRTGNGTNTSGFAGLPGGYYSGNGSFYNFRNCGYWWSSSEDNTGSASYFLVFHHLNLVFRNYQGKQSGFSVRCIKDI